MIHGRCSVLAAQHSMFYVVDRDHSRLAGNPLSRISFAETGDILSTSLQARAPRTHQRRGTFVLGIAET